MGGRRDLPISSSAWLMSIDEDQWLYWEKQFGQHIDAAFRGKVDLCLMDFRDAKSRYYDENRVSVSDLRKRIKRLLKRNLDEKELDDKFAQDQICKINGCDQSLSFQEQAELALDELNDRLHDSTMDSPKPEAFFTAAVFNLFEEKGMRVNRTSGSKRDSCSSLDPVSPTPIEAFILRHIWETSDPCIRDVDKIRKNIKRFK